MVKVLECLSGQYDVLICESFDNETIGNNLNIIGTLYCITVQKFNIDEPKSCFSKPKTKQITLLEKVNLSSCGEIQYVY